MAHPSKRKYKHYTTGLAVGSDDIKGRPEQVEVTEEIRNIGTIWK